MDTRFDELSKSLAANIPRREAVRRIGKGLFGMAVGTVLAAFGSSASAQSGICVNGQPCPPGLFCCHCQMRRGNASYCTGTSAGDINACTWYRVQRGC